MMLRNFKIKTRLLISFFIIALFTLIVGLTGYIRLILLGDSAVKTINNVRILNDAYDFNIAIETGIFGMLYTSDITLNYHVLQTTKEYTERFLTYLNEYLELQDQFGDAFTPGERQDMANLLEMYEGNYIPVVNEIFDLIEQGRKEEALSIYINRFTLIYDTFIYYINSVFIKNLDYSVTETARNNESSTISAYLMLAIVLLSLIVSIILALAVTKSIAAPLSELEVAAEQVANGKLDVQFEVSQSNDEIAHLSQRLDETIQQLHQTQQIKLEKEKAETANRTKSDFLATMSHEIRTPLNAIIGITQIQLQNENLTDEFAAALEKIYSSGKNLLGIINDILDMSKIETGKMELNPAEYDVPSMINDAVMLNIVRISSRPIEFRLELDENMPSRLYGDELRIKQILNNLLSNAIKYTEKGSVKLSVDHTIEGGDIILRFIVKDTGQGMKKEDRERLFSEYLRFNVDANRTTEGTGLGLNITKKLIEMMNGSIAVESEFGKGSVFTVTVKQKAVECVVIGAEMAQRLRNFIFSGDRQAAQQRIIREPMPYGSVLVVDDLETNLYVAEGMLLPYKLNIETADSGFAAMEKVQAAMSGSGKIYDIIFMDHMMPKMDGIETTKKIRQWGYKGIIVALTANAMTGNDEMFSQHGFDGFIPKPIDIHHLNTVLNRFIRDKYPEEAKKYQPIKAPPITAASQTADEKTAKLLQIFRRDAEKAILTLRETAPHHDDTKLLTTTTHAMKSALANIGKHELSQQAAMLEQAGLQSDRNFITANIDNFINALELLINELNNSKVVSRTNDTANADIEEDTDYLKTQLQIIKKSCEEYDDNAAFAALDRLKEKQWTNGTTSALARIHEALFLHSDFEGAVELIVTLFPE